MGMNGFSALEIGASAASLVLILALMVALDDRGKAGQAYREAMKNLFYLAISVFTMPIPLAARILAPIVAPRSNYAYRLAYQGRHFL